MTDWQQVALAGIVALALSLGLVPVARHWALRLGVTDRPGKGKVHRVPTPYLGGLAVAAAVAGAAMVGGWRGEAMAVLGAALLVACVGLADDVGTARPSVRLAVETVAATIAFTAGARVQVLGGWLDLALTIVWLVVLTNAYNLLDNMDACASSVVLVSASALLAAAALGDQVLVGTLAAALVGAAAGFLAYNCHPARIFLGDAGSLFLGFLVSATALKLRFPVDRHASVIAVGLVAAPALFDTTLVVLSRVRAGRPIYIGGTDHTSHRLAGLGLPAGTVAVLLATASAACGALGVAVGHGAMAAWTAAAPVLLLSLALLAFLLRMPVYAHGAGRLVVPAARFSLSRRPTEMAADV